MKQPEEDSYDYATLACGNETDATPSSEVPVKIPSKFAKSAFKQERLKAICKPIYSDLVVFLIYLSAGFICLGCCGYMYYENSFNEALIDYTYCKNSEGKHCSDLIKINSSGHIKDGDKVPICTCTLEFNIKNDIMAPVGAFIRISNFFQNHRLYVASLDVYQMMGHIYRIKRNKTHIVKTSPISPSEGCLEFDSSYQLKNDKKYVFPCGARAYSWFSDRFQLFSLHEKKKTEIVLNNKDIAWKSDVKHTFKNPQEFTSKDYDDRPPWFDKYFKKPASWRQDTFEDWWKDGALENEAFINWMRVSIHMDTVKLFRTVSKSKCASFQGLCKGNYSLDINYNFETTSFGGTKQLIFRTLRTNGTKNNFLMIMFATVGIVALVLAPIIFCSFPSRTSIIHDGDDHMLPIQDELIGTTLFHNDFGGKPTSTEMEIIKEESELNEK